MRNAWKAGACRAAARLLVCLLIGLAMALPLAAEDAASGNSAEAGEAASEAALPAASAVAQGDTVSIGAAETRTESGWEASVSFPLKSTGNKKSYTTMAGNVLRLTVYSSVPQDGGAAFYLPMDSHIQYVDGTDRFAMTGRSGSYYCYQKEVKIAEGGSFDLAVANTNTVLYSGLYDTLSITAYDEITSMDFLAGQSAGNAAVTNFYVTANGSATALITPDTSGFNTSDNEWKIVTAEKTEKVLFPGTVYSGYTFDPATIHLTVTADADALADPVTVQVYYLGLINGRLFTVGPYSFPARAATYSSTFALAADQLDVLATENTATFFVYLEQGRVADLTVTDAEGVAALKSVTPLESDRSGLDKLAVTVSLSDTARDLDLLVGNRWSTNQIGYNYHTLHVRFLRDIQSLSLTGQQDGHYHMTYAATVNGQSGLDTTAVNWYINGKLQPEHGLTLDRRYRQGGRYLVYAELGGLTSNTVDSEIIYAGWQAILWYSLLALVLAAAALALRHNARLRGARMDVRLRNQLQEMLETMEDLQVRLVRQELSPPAAMRAMTRLSRRMGLLCDDLLARYNDTNIVTYREAALSLQRAQRLARAYRSRNDPYYARAVLNTGQRALRQALTDLQAIAALAVR